MKRLSMLLVGLASVISTARALPPDEKDLKGEFWDEWNVDKVEFLAGGKATWTTFSTQAVIRGKFSIPDDSSLKFAPDDGAPARTWTYALHEGFLVLVDARGVQKTYRRESLDARRGRTADVFIEIALLDKARRAAGDESDDAALSLKHQELESQYTGLLLSLGEDPKGPPPPSIVLIVKAHRPDVIDDMLAALEQARASSRAVDCKNRLKQIGIYVCLYEAKFKKWPQTMKDLMQEGLAEDENLFVCPLCGKAGSYTFVAPSKGDDTPPDFIVGYDTDAHPDGMRSVLTFQGSVFGLDAEDFAVAKKDGAKAAGPHLKVTSAKVLAIKDGYEAVVEGTITNLRPLEKDGKKLLSADLELSSFSRGSFRAKPQRFEGPVADDGLPFHAVLKLGAKDPGTGMAVMIDLRDFGRGKTRFNEYVDFDSVGKEPRR